MGIGWLMVTPRRGEYCAESMVCDEAAVPTRQKGTFFHTHRICFEVFGDATYTDRGRSAPAGGVGPIKLE